MKKIFQIASYDYKRLLLNPFMLGSMILILIALFIITVYSPVQPTPLYSANVAGETTKEVYDNFNLTISENETRGEYLKNLEEAEEFLSIQTECQDSTKLENLRDVFDKIQIQMRKYILPPHVNTYTENGSLQEVETAVEQLENFIQTYKTSAHFQSNIYFYTEDFAMLENSSNFLYQVISSSESIENKVAKMSDNLSMFDNIKNAISSKVVLQIGENMLTNLRTNYIETAKQRLGSETPYNVEGSIEFEMEKLSNQTIGDFKHKDDMLALVTSFKLTCESAKKGVENELLLLIKTHFKNLDKLYSFEDCREENIKVELAKINYYLHDTNLYYSQSQQPLNFNSASYEITAYDRAYYAISVVGFLDIIFAIFCAYKLFGRDRKNGKMDVILSQNVTYGQVFAGKVLAIFFITGFTLALYAMSMLLFSIIVYPTLPGTILAVFNLSTTYTIHPFAFLLIKLITIELQAMFYAVLCVFVMNLSRKFDIGFAAMLVVFALATVLNIYLNGSLVYCLLPFIHADLSRMLGGGTMDTGFLVTSLYSSGNFVISLVYYLVVVVLLYTFTKQLFKKN